MVFYLASQCLFNSQLPVTDKYFYNAIRFFFVFLHPIFLSTMKANTICLLLLATVTLFSCGVFPKGTNPPNEGETVSFNKEQVWQLVTLRGKSLPSSWGNVTMTLNPEGGILKGVIACNRYSARYSCHLESTDANGVHYRMEIEQLGIDGVQCPEADMALQERYLSLFAKSDACILTSHSVTLFYNGKETLHYELE